MILSLLKLKCPRCRKGNLFAENNPYKLKKLSDMHQSCSCCGQLSEPEPGFYYGAMYVSYGLCTAIFFINFIIFELIFPLPGYSFLWLNSILLLVLWPYIFKLSRILYLSIFVRFDPKACEKYREKPQSRV